ncbi:MAG: TetR/AcrR family transcriptional regulator [Holophagales bacterium]|nr:TetR/AcrR family transcriptional regulator [Holophagales bacterium]
MPSQKSSVQKPTAKKPTKPLLFDDERAGKIYRTAARMIYEKGFDATSMNEIAEAVDLTKPGLYYYVKGKKELLFAIMSFAMDLLDSEAVGPAREIEDPEERLRIIVRQHARLLTHETGALAILIDEVGGLSDSQKEAITHRKRAYFDFIRDTLTELAEAGRLKPVDPTTATFSLLGMVMWIARWYEPGGRLGAEEVVRDLTEIAVAGVLVPASPGVVERALG